MSATLISGIVVACAFVAFIVWAARNGNAQLALEADKRKRCHAASARVQEILQAVLFAQRNETSIRLRVSVERPGFPPYETTCKWSINPIQTPRVQPGAVIAVIIDPDDPRRLFPKEDWAKLNEDIAAATNA